MPILRQDVSAGQLPEKTRTGECHNRTFLVYLPIYIEQYYLNYFIFAFVMTIIKYFFFIKIFYNIMCSIYILCMIIILQVLKLMLSVYAIEIYMLANVRTKLINIIILRPKK